MAVDISPFIKDAQNVQARTGIPASIILGQIMLESAGKYAGGLSGLAAQSKNLFGIKGSGTAGSVLLPTTEVINGVPKMVNANFRKYNSYTDSINDHAELLTSDRYASKIKNAKSVDEYAAGIKAGGYATDPQYVSKLLSVIGLNNLHQYDSADITFKGDAIGSASGGSDEGEEDKTFVESLFFNIIKALLIFGVFVLMILFFLRAFPATSDAADVVGDIANPVNNVKRVAKMAKSRKAAKQGE